MGFPNRSSNAKHGLIILLVHLNVLGCFCVSRDISLFPTLHLHVKHQISPDKMGQNKQLMLHCRSKDDDLGLHYLNYGEQQSWSFRENVVFRTTWFLCTGNYTSNENLHLTKEFYVYNNDKPCIKCSKDCTWVARETAIYRGTNYNDPYWLWDLGTTKATTKVYPDDLCWW